MLRLEVSTDRTGYVVTNDLTQNLRDETQKVCAIRWKIEQLHREVKQTTGLERSQCRKQSIQREPYRLCIIGLVSFQRTEA